MMRLIEGLTPTRVGDTFVVVPTGKSATIFHGMIRNNETAQFLYELLTENTTEEKLVKAMMASYDVDEATALRDIRIVLNQLRDAGLLNET